jgi:hypothetical protein
MSNQNAPTTVEVFEQQKKRHADLSQRAARAEAMRDAELANHERLSAEALTVLGTADIDTIRNQYQAGETANERTVGELVFSLDEVERELQDIERVTTQKQ